jgi:hypothetical protein
MVHLIKSKATSKQVSEMLKSLGHYIKVAVDIERGILAGGGVMHADCEQLLIESGSKQKNVWGGDWHPKDKRIEFESLIIIRPRQNNRSMKIQDSKIKDAVERIIRDLLDT